MTDLERLEEAWPLGWEMDASNEVWCRYEVFFRGLTATVHVRTGEVHVDVLGSSRGHACAAATDLGAIVRWLSDVFEEEADYLQRESEALREIVDGYRLRTVSAERSEA